MSILYGHMLLHVTNLTHLTSVTAFDLLLLVA